MGMFDKFRDTANQVKDAAVQKAVKTSESIKSSNAEAKELKKPLEGALARYEFTYKGGLEDIPKAKSGAWGMNIMPDGFAFRVTNTTKDWLYDYDIAYDQISDIRIEKRSISNAEWLLGAGNDANQQQENVVVIEYTDSDGKKQTLRVEMLTGVTIFKQAANCKELMDLLRRNDILDRIQGGGAKKSSGNSSDDVISQIEKLAALKDKGILSEEEFTAKKTELMAKL